MSDAYKVEIDPHHPGCECCGEGRMWWIVDPEGCGSGASYRDEVDAEEAAGTLNRAFELGLAAGERRGAEAMRERCAEVADTGTENPQWISADIRALPLPGDGM